MAGGVGPYLVRASGAGSPARGGTTVVSTSQVWDAAEVAWGRLEVGLVLERFAMGARASTLMHAFGTPRAELANRFWRGSLWERGPQHCSTLLGPHVRSIGSLWEARRAAGW